MATNLIVNGTFDNIATWHLQLLGTGAAGTMSKMTVGTNNLCKVNITGIGTSQNLHQYGFNLKPNTVYTLTFGLYADKSVDVGIQIMDHLTPYKSIWAAIIKSNTVMTNYGMSFRTPAAVNPDSRLKFRFLAIGTYYIDNVILTENPTNLIKNGIFDSLASWGLQLLGIGAAGTMSKLTVGTNNLCKVNITGIGESQNLHQYGFNLKPNTAYTLMFGLYADKSVEVGIQIMDHLEPYTSIINIPIISNIILTDYNILFVTPAVVNPDSRLKFRFLSIGSYYVDNVVLVENAVSLCEGFTSRINIM